MGSHCATTEDQIQIFIGEGTDWILTPRKLSEGTFQNILVCCYPVVCITLCLDVDFSAFTSKIKLLKDTLRDVSPQYHFSHICARLWSSNSKLWFSLSELHAPAALLLTVCSQRLEIGDKQSVTTALLPGWH